jgi:hypothetical protein
MGRPHGHREAPLLKYNFIRVAQPTRRCKRLGRTTSVRLQQDEVYQFQEDRFKTGEAVERSGFCGKLAGRSG